MERVNAVVFNEFPNPQLTCIRRDRQNISQSRKFDPLAFWSKSAKGEGLMFQKRKCEDFTSFSRNASRCVENGAVEKYGGGADPGFWSGEPSRVLTPGGPLSLKFAQNRGFPLFFAWKPNDFGGNRGPGSKGPLDPLVLTPPCLRGDWEFPPPLRRR